MNEKETAFIALLKAYHANSETVDILTVHSALRSLMLLPFHAFSNAFIQHPDFQHCVNVLAQYTSDLGEKTTFWYKILLYLHAKDDPSYQTVLFAEFELWISKFIDYESGKKQAGTHMPVPGMTDNSLIKHIYLSDDTKLIQFIQKYSQLPPTRLFDPKNIPTCVSDHDNTVMASIKNHIGSQHERLELIEKSTITIQRHFRYQHRLKEESHRIKKQYLGHSFFRRNATWANINSKKIMHNANRPYVPETPNKKLVTRIMTLTQSAELYETIRHVTAHDTLDSVLDEGLFGRRNLEAMHIPFKPAAFMSHDLANGDGNVVCFGTNKIDPKATGNIEITYRIKPLEKSKLPALYKLQDFQYSDCGIRKIHFDGDYFCFSLAKPFLEDAWCRLFEEQKSTQFQIHDPESNMGLYRTRIPHCLLISYDIKNFSQILMLHLFRFIDALETLEDTPATDYIETFYDKLDKMDDVTLSSFLEEAGRALSDTAEFNFYGAHKLDFSAVVNIRNRDSGYALHLPSLIETLNMGETSPLEEAHANMPNLLHSYRFIDYLLANTSNMHSQQALLSFRDTCQVPKWLGATVS